MMTSMDQPPAVTWARVDRDFYVASTPQYFLGTVDRDASGSFVARDMRSEVIGTFSDLASATDAVENHKGSRSALMTPTSDREGER